MKVKVYYLGDKEPWFKGGKSLKCGRRREDWLPSSQKSDLGKDWFWYNLNNLRYADNTILLAESKELKSLLIKMKEESEKVGLKFNIQKMKIMSSGPITSWEIERETVECQTLFLGAPKSLQMVIATMKLKDTYSLEEKLWPT